MAMKSGVLDHWRKYFRSANSDIFGVIENAIIIAAADCPKEFRKRRDKIAEKLFSCRLTRCFGCDRVELAVPEEDGDDRLHDDIRGDGGFCGKESKVNSSTNDRGEMNPGSNYSYDEAEALTEEIEEESQIVGEVLRIKEILANKQEQSDSALFESLRRLQLMDLSVEALQATEIGKAVNGIRKHGSKQIRHLARALIDGWKDMVDSWINATTAIADNSPDSVNPSVVNYAIDEGLPSPPLDEGAFLATQTTGIELSQFFDGMDDDGNPRSGCEFDKNRGNGRKAEFENLVPKRKEQPPPESSVLKDEKIQMRKHETITRQTKPSNLNSGPGRPLKLSSENKGNEDTNLQRQMDLAGAQRKPQCSLDDKSKYSDELSVQMKIEASKRKLHERYQQAENAKKQRTIQVMELHDLPKQEVGHKNPYMKPVSHRHWANRRY